MWQYYFQIHSHLTFELIMRPIDAPKPIANNKKVLSWKIKKYSLIKSGFVLLDFLPGKFMKLRIDVDDLILRFHLLALFQVVVDLLSPVEDGAELVVGRHGSFSAENPDLLKWNGCANRYRASASCGTCTLQNDRSNTGWQPRYTLTLKYRPIRFFLSKNHLLNT